MNILRILGLAILAVGIVVILFGFNSSQKIGEQVIEGVSGRFTQGTMMYILGGIALVVAGFAVCVTQK